MPVSPFLMSVHILLSPCSSPHLRGELKSQFKQYLKQLSEQIFQKEHNTEERITNLKWLRDISKGGLDKNTQKRKGKMQSWREAEP